MILYFIPFFIAICGIIQYDIGKHKRHEKIIYVLLLIYITFLIGFRYRVGIDTLNYMHSYNEIPTFNRLSFSDLFTQEYQPSYFLLCVVAKSISPDFFILQLFHAFILNACVFYFIRKNTNYPFCGLFFYFIMYFFYFNTEIMRESLSIAIFLLNYNNLKNKKWIKYYCGVFISVMFHLSGLILIFLPLFFKIRLDKKFIILVIVFLFILFSLQPYLELLNIFEKIGDKVNAYAYASENRTMSDLWVFFLFIQGALLPFIALYYTKYIYKGNVLFENLICIQIILGIGIVHYEIIFSRFTNYFMPFYSLLVAEMIGSAIIKHKITKFGIVLSFCLIMLVYGYDFWSHEKYKFWIPYNSIFFPQKNVEREKMWEERFGI